MTTQGGSFSAEPIADSPIGVRLSLIVCTYQRPAALRRLLAAALQVGPLPEEICVVDASLDDASERVVGELKKQNASSARRLEYVRASVAQRGLTKQRNLGLTRTRGAAVAFLDDDTLPADDYFPRLLATLDSSPEVVGAGGWIRESSWKRAAATVSPAGFFRVGEWERPLGSRWRLRQHLGLGSQLPPGRLPEGGHGMPVSFLPPDGERHAVDFLMGGASVWRRELFERVAFSEWFEGYGLYEDLEFCIRAGAFGQLLVDTGAVLEHLHEPSGRPRPFRYGMMVLRNGWKVWRTAWPRPSFAARLRWWATSALLAAVRAANVLTGPHRGEAGLESLGRLFGALSVLLRAPEVDFRGQARALDA